MASSHQRETKKKTHIIELDNNATTRVCAAAKKAYFDFIDCPNASTSSKYAKPIQRAVENTRDNILRHCGVNSATHTVIFTSGASESNSMIVRMCVKSYKKRLRKKGLKIRPHLIISAIEHNSVLDCANDLLACGEIELSIVQPSVYGVVAKESVEAEIRDNTCLVSIMYANNEVPAVNNIKEIGKIVRSHGVPMHSDCVQIFGKYMFNIVDHNIDAISVSGHKFYGPKGSGLLILNNDLISGYAFTAEISGKQQDGLRGGTENVAAIVSIGAALTHAFQRRKEKNAHLFELRDYLLKAVAAKLPMVNSLYYLCDDEALREQKLQPRKKDVLEVVSLGPPAEKHRYLLPNTVLISVCKNIGKPFCNTQLKEYLDSKNIIVSVGSACNTKSDKASHVVNAIGAPPVVKRGVLRVSFCDTTTRSDIDAFVHEYCRGILRQCGDIRGEKCLEKIEKPQ